MRNLFGDLVRDGETGLNGLVQARQQESVQLDFKCKADNSHGSPNDDDKRTLAEALSGFANSAGGLLIWGVDARKGADGIDCARSLQPIAQIESFHSAVNGLIGQLVMPKLEGVKTAIIPASGSVGAGYLLLDVDRSERRPHRAEAKGKKSYIKRIGDSFFEMEHYDIEDAFKRVQVPELEFVWDAYSSKVYDLGGFKATIALQLENVSLQTARFPYLSVANLRGAALPFDGYYESPDVYRTKIERGNIYFTGDANIVVNPEARSSVAHRRAD